VSGKFCKRRWGGWSWYAGDAHERYQRSERALVEMYVQRVSTRKVKAITEERCGYSFSASSISAMKRIAQETFG
jgi:putative transposase